MNVLLNMIINNPFIIMPIIITIFFGIISVIYYLWNVKNKRDSNFELILKFDNYTLLHLAENK